jgi:carbamoyltransferase
MSEVVAHLGLGKTLFHSSAALIRPQDTGRPRITLALSERLLRKKASGAWPERAIRQLDREAGLKENIFIAENRDVTTPAQREEVLNLGVPFYDYLTASGMARFSRRLNPEVEFVSHHRCHAMAAVLMSPYEKALIVVLDGAGTRAPDFPPDAAEIEAHPPGPGFPAGSVPHEECSVYLLDRDPETGRPDVRCVRKRWRVFDGDLSDGVGIFYETIAKHIFNCTRSAGKVMGLAPLARASAVPPADRLGFLRALDSARAFTSKGKAAWENCGEIARFTELAATAQAVFEDDVGALVEDLRRSFPSYGNLILTGGCALNCTFNGKLARRGWFDDVYVPPFPGDESIGLGAAAHLYFQRGHAGWTPFAHEEQHGYFGPSESVPSEERVRAAFADGFVVERPASIVEHAAKLLNEGHILAWFQGRSESGPRALGNRSLLARPDRPGLKDYLNAHIKFREAFRPYGASVTQARAADYFDVPAGFNTPYMSFATPTRAGERDRLREITHVDGTCRYQSVRPGQNQRFHDLIDDFGRKSGLFCLLNTSLNVMGEPIVETPMDARRFLERMREQDPVPVHGLAIGDFYVRAAAR